MQHDRELEDRRMSANCVEQHTKGCGNHYQQTSYLPFVTAGQKSPIILVGRLGVSSVTQN